MESSSKTRVLLPQYAARLFRSSFATCFSVLIAARYELWACAASALLVLLTSLNYWRDPVAGWRRSVDIAAVVVGIVYHVYCSAFCAPRAVQALYVLFLLQAAYCYRRAREAPTQDASSAWHCGVHVSGNVANMLLYTGLAV
ncbi:hypothetical protein PybrP1_009409 [[Pythium] brassicae (nom. inval.)]|nr:hypothetical protein PybrP1_009409 [[Pythium] brassicae (nom. inval.)]